MSKIKEKGSSKFGEGIQGHLKAGKGRCSVLGWVMLHFPATLSTLPRTSCDGLSS